MLKNKKYLSDNIVKFYLFGGLVCLLVFCLVSYSRSYAASDGFIQSYNAATNLQQGMIVQLKSDNTNSVIPATQSTILKTFGIIVNINNATIAVQNQNKAGDQVFVANSGHYSILVSDQNGEILPGDYVTLSPVDGIGMKDDSTEPIVVAEALQAFNNTSPILGTDMVKTSSGNLKVHLGIIEANIGIGHNPLLVTSESGVPKVLAKISSSITGKQVSAWRIWLGISILFVVSFIVGTMLYGAVKSSLISIGRNPLSKKVISRGFLEVVLASLIILISSIFGVYLLLKV